MGAQVNLKRRFPGLYRRLIALFRVIARARKAAINFGSGAIVALLSAITLAAIGITANSVFSNPECAWVISELIDFGECKLAEANDDRPPLDIWFVWFVLAFVATFLFREIAIASKGKSANAALVSYIETFPPSNVMNEFSETWDVLARFLTELAPVDSKEKAEASIRLCLSAICVIAARFDHAPLKPRYAANIMLYSGVSSLESAGKNVSELIGDEEAVFIGDDQCLDKLEGVLMLDPSLTASTDNDDYFDLDTLSSKKVLLPVPAVRFDKDSGRRLYLPGAVEALVDDSGNCIIPDTRRLLDSYHQSSDPEIDGHDFRDIPLQVFEQIHNYFCKDEAGQLARSFVSIRIKDDDSASISAGNIEEGSLELAQIMGAEQPDQDENLAKSTNVEQNTSVLGVMNVHCDLAQRFSYDTTTNNYLRLVKPVLSKIAELLVERAKYT